ncbi:MAG TPA: ankyrin repeat domain-containing protein [Verrucomicrobiae bacterium]
MKTQRTSAAARLSSHLVLAIAAFSLNCSFDGSAQPATAPAKIPAYEATGRLLNAIQFNGTLEDVRSLLEQGADANAKGNEGWHALQFAAKRGDIEIVRLLLEKGADVNGTNDWGAAALNSAAFRGNFELTRFLLEKGADQHHRDFQGQSPIVDSVSGANTNVIDYLLSKGDNVNETNFGGESLLILAVENGHADIVSFLLAHGANVNAETPLGDSALDKARLAENSAIIRLLQNAGAGKSSSTKANDAETAAIGSLGKAVNAFNNGETSPLPSAPASAPPPINRLVASGGYTDSQGYVTNANLLKPFTLTNSAGVVVNDAVLVKLTANKFLYKSSAGGGMLRLDALPPELQARFGYDAATASAQDSAEAAARAERARAEQLQRESLQQQASAAPNQGLANNVALIIRAKAAKEWPTDYDMQAFVIKKQTEAYNWVASTSSAPGVPQTVFAQIKAKAAEEWPDDYDMQKFVINKQVQAYRGLQ